MHADILDVAIEHIANDDYTRVTEDELKRRLADIRRTHVETRLWERADEFIAEVRDVLMTSDEYGPPFSRPSEHDCVATDDGDCSIR